jgi:hypothetical protein
MHRHFMVDQVARFFLPLEIQTIWKMMIQVAWALVLLPMHVLRAKEISDVVINPSPVAACVWSWSLPWKSPGQNTYNYASLTIPL